MVADTIAVVVFTVHRRPLHSTEVIGMSVGMVCLPLRQMGFVSAVIVSSMVLLFGTIDRSACDATFTLIVATLAVF